MARKRKPRESQSNKLLRLLADDVPVPGTVVPSGDVVPIETAAELLEKFVQTGLKDCRPIGDLSHSQIRKRLRQEGYDPDEMERNAKRDVARIQAMLFKPKV